MGAGVDARVKTRVKLGLGVTVSITSTEDESSPRVSKALSPVRTVMTWLVREGSR